MVGCTKPNCRCGAEVSSLCGSPASLAYQVAGMAIEDVSHSNSEALGVVQVEELIRAVGVASRAQHSGHGELGGRESPLQHRHERNRATLAERPMAGSIRCITGVVERVR